MTDDEPNADDAPTTVLSLTLGADDAEVEVEVDGDITLDVSADDVEMVVSTAARVLADVVLGSNDE